jgi:N-methylhydantoinase A
MAAAHGQGRLRMGIDTGGTFTDVVAVDAASGEMRVTRSARLNPALALVRGVNAILGRLADRLVMS